MTSKDNFNYIKESNEFVVGSIIEEIWYYKWYFIYQIIFIMILYNFPIIEYFQSKNDEEKCIWGAMIVLSITIPILAIKTKFSDTAYYIYENNIYKLQKRKKSIYIACILVLVSHSLSIWIAITIK